MISYDDALANLMAMFPDMDTETIAVVLRDHGGHMERTIDALLVMRGQKPVNVESGPLQVARDEAIALELQRRMVVQAEMAQQQQRQPQRPRVQAQARPRTAAPQQQRLPPAQYPAPTLPMTDPILDSMEALGEKVKELWSKVSGKTSSGPRNQTAQQRAGGKYQALSTGDDEGDEDEDEIGFDTSLTKRYAVAEDEDEDAEDDKAAASTEGAGSVELKPIGTQQAQPPRENKKTL